MTKGNIINSKKNIFNSSSVGRPLGRAQRLEEELAWLKERFGATDEELRALLLAKKVAAASPNASSRPLRPDILVDTVPVAIFVPSLGILEALVLHLDAQGGRLDDIAARLHRSYSTVANTLRNARKKVAKHKARAARPSASSPVEVPLKIFAQRRTAPLQALVAYLHDERKLRFAEIARLLGRDPRNICATYAEARR